MATVVHSAISRACRAASLRQIDQALLTCYSKRHRRYFRGDIIDRVARIPSIRTLPTWSTLNSFEFWWNTRRRNDVGEKRNCAPVSCGFLVISKYDSCVAWGCQPDDCNEVKMIGDDTDVAEDDREASTKIGTIVYRASSKSGGVGVHQSALLPCSCRW